MVLPEKARVLLLFCAFYVNPSAEASASEESKCNMLLSSGFNYGHFFKISDLKEVHGDGISFRFRVKARSDAHIKFSERPFPSAQEPAYEVVIGAGDDTFSFIRKKEVEAAKIRLDTPDIMSPEEARGFWIRISKSGRLDVGKEGNVLPFMSWEDNSPLDIKYFSFSSWHNVNAEWFYNCDELKGNHSKDRVSDLVNFLFGSGNGDTEIEPPIDTDMSNFTNVFTHLSCNRIHLDDRRSVLVVDGVLSLLWVDKRKMWSPKEFRNKQYLDWHSYGVWTPSVMLKNTADNRMKNKKRSNSKVRIYPNGTLLWKYPVHFSAFCQGIDHLNWPMDSHVCELQLGLMKTPHSSLRMILLKDGIHLQESTIHTGWHINKVYAEAKRIPTLIESSHKNLDNNRSPEPDHIIFVFSLTRSSNIYHTALIICLTAISMLILSSFWASPLGSVKIGLQCISLVIASVSLLFCWKMIPAHSYRNLPTVFSAFIMVMHMVWIAIVSSVVTSNIILSAPARVQSSVSSLLKSKFLSMFFCLPQPSNQIAECYRRLSDGRPMSKEEPHGYSFMSNESETQWSWILISIVTDRILFCVYTVLFSYLFYISL